MRRFGALSAMAAVLLAAVVGMQPSIAATGDSELGSVWAEAFAGWGADD